MTVASPDGEAHIALPLGRIRPRGWRMGQHRLQAEPIGITLNGAIALSLMPTEAPEASSTTPLDGLTGSGSNVFESDCDGNPATYDYTLELIRTGD
ncbi:MAG: hypothetical protein H0V64_08125 [Geodermatophilaceae bacterium]|jgi:hypothetical protein|nr:hypothetical protein [Geodermatophilaceae bacterium]